MAYCSKADVRFRLDLESFKPSDTELDAFIAKADAELDEELVHVRNFIEDIEILTGNKVVTLSHDFEVIKEILVNGKWLKELNPKNLLTDGDIEDIITSTNLPDYWTKTASGDDALSAATDKTFIRDRSLKINKDAAGTSYWYSDGEVIGDKDILVAKARIKVDSNTSTNTSLKLLMRDSAAATEATHSSATVTQEITQPSATGTVSIASDSTSDTTQAVIIDGLVDNLRTTERIALNGTTPVAGKKSFSEIFGVRLSSAPAGTVTITRGVTICTLTSSALEKQNWQEIEIEGETTDDTQDFSVRLHCSASSGNCWGDHFRVYKRNWKPLAASKQILFLHGLKKGDMVKVKYHRSEQSKLVKELSRDLTSLYVIVHLCGGETSGANFTALKAHKFGMWERLGKVIIADFEKNLERVKSYDGVASNFIMGETYTAED